MNAWEFLKHGIGGSTAIAATEMLVKNRLKKAGVEGVEKDKKVAIGVGATGGVFLGYYLGELVGNHDRNYSMREKAVSSLIGGAAGATAGALIGNYLGLKREYEKEIVEEEKAKIKQGE